MIKDVLRDFVFGMEDGLVSNLGLVLGVYFGGGSPYAVVLAGLASMFAGAFSMSAGSYLSAKSEREVLEHETSSIKKQLHENPSYFIEETKKLLKEEGLKDKEVSLLLGRHSKEKHTFICNYLIHRKVGVSEENFDKPMQNATAMFVSYLIGASFPIVPFILVQGNPAVILASILTILALFVVGWVKTYYTKRNPWKSGLEIVLVGLGAGIVGYLVGWILSIVGSF